jgi:hypothetical protein
MPAKKGEVVRANLRLDAEQYRRLLVFSVMESRSAGEIVSKLLEDHLKGWSMPGKVTSRQNTQSASPAPSLQLQGDISADAA